MTVSLFARTIHWLGVMLMILTATALFASPASAAEGRKRAAVAAARPVPMLSATAFRQQQEWRKTIATVPKPSKGCFTAKYPSTKWKAVPCVASPNYPMPPRTGIVPQIVGGGNDIAAQAPSGVISSAIGTFDTLTNVTSETGQVGAAGPMTPNTYTLQINTDFFKSSVCAGSPNPDCRGWEQFVFENNNVSHRAYIQYWLIQYNTTCPSGWQQFPISGNIYCVILSNSTGAVGTPPVPVTNLGQVTLTGNADAAGDSVVMTIGGTAYARVGDDAVKASSGWSIAEFNVFGDGGNSSGVGGQANFNAGAALTTRTHIVYGGNGPPNCVAQGFTAETNNLSFGPTAPAASAPGPAILFNESIAGGSPSNCAASTAVGDTHLTTLSGLLYDFQASGDFVMLHTGSGFDVQNRQVSGAPNWPNAAVSSVVAARLGKTEVAVCVKPRGVFIDGKPVTVTEKKPIALADGTQVTLTGNTYLIRGATGDWMQAGVNVGSGTDYINLKVGLGQWPTEAHGLLANVKENPNLLATREGEVLKNPFSFEQIYRPYADSWRVRSGESMLDVCGERTMVGIPTKPFTSRELDPKTMKNAQLACARAGVKEGPLLEACLIDVAMIGNAAAANVHANTVAPKVLGLLR